MSRQFNPTTNFFLTRPSPASNSLAVLTLSAWVLVTSYGDNGFPIIVKSPNNEYTNSIYVDSDGTLRGSAGGAGSVSGYVDGLVVNPGHGGTGYVLHDTALCVGHGDGLCRAKVNQVDGGGAGPGEITDLGTINSFGGSGYAVNDTGALTNIIGSGVNGQYKITSVTTHNTFSVSVSVETLPLNVWTHVAMTCDLTGDAKVRLYINHVECTYVSQDAGGVPADDSDEGWGLGADAFGDVGIVQMKQVAVFNTKLTDAQLAALAASPNSVSGVADANLVAYWRLTGANPEQDLTGNTPGLIITATAPATTAATTPFKQSQIVTTAAPAQIN